MTQKDYSGYLIIDWRNGSMRLRQSNPQPLNPQEVVVKFKLTIKVPDLQIPIINIGTIEIPEVKVEATEFQPETLSEDNLLVA